VPEPGPGQVRIRVQACGVCHSDVLVKDGGWPGLAYPRVPGTRSPVSSTPLPRTSPGGPRASASVSAGTVVRTARAWRAAGGTSRTARA
jgi:hypothetical protein